MSSEIRISHEVIDGIDLSLVTQEGSEALRTSVVLPFSTEPINSGSMPHETPHVMEHVVCSGDGSMDSAEYQEYMASKGGHTNAYTSATNNGLLNFETIQPDDATDRVIKMISSVFSPALDQAVLDSEREIVRNELRGYLQDPARQRRTTKDYWQGITYKTEETGLAGLDTITVEVMRELHANTFTRQNARIVLAGSPQAAETVALQIPDITKAVPDGKRIVAASGLIVPLPNYNAPAPEKPSGTTEYTYTVVSNHEEIAGSDFSELRIAVNALFSFIKEGENGIHNQSRARGLSYGVNSWTTFGKDQVALSVSDTTMTNHVEPQIALFHESLRRLETYTANDFDNYRTKQLGSAKIRQEDVLALSGTVGSLVGRDLHDYIISADSYRALLAESESSTIVEAVKRLGQRLQNADFVIRHSFGDNPF
jgi:predicted Zn-dependent peptidase